MRLAVLMTLMSMGLSGSTLPAQEKKEDREMGIRYREEQQRGTRPAGPGTDTRAVPGC